MNTQIPRALGERKNDTLERLERDVDCWVATADAAGTPYLVPLSFRWDGTSLLVATPATGPTGRNLRAAGRVRLAVGETRDVVLLDCTVAEAIPAGDLPADEGDAFAVKSGFDPRELTGYLYFRIQPHRVQAWREANELSGRDLMRDGRWLA
jgi:Pyridoxamine 5'-phosphate oxidase